MMSLWGLISGKRRSESESRNNNVEETLAEETPDTDESSNEDSDPAQDDPHGSSTEDGPIVKDSRTDKCPQHEKELIQYYCPIHDNLGCGVCIMIDHRNCQGAVYIPKVADEILETQEFKEYEKELADLNEMTEKIMTHSKENISKADKTYKEALQSAETFKKEKLSRLEQMQVELKTKAQSCKDEDTEKVKTVLNKSTTTKNEVCKMQSDLETLVRDKQLCQLYIEIKMAKKQISMIRETLEKLEEQNVVRSYKLVPGKRKFDLLEGLDEEVPGSSNDEYVPEKKRQKVVSEPTGPREVKAEHMTDVCIRSDTDKSIVCKAAGLVILPGNRLVVADKNNCKVKLVDTLQNKIISELDVPSAPLGVTAISEKQVVIALKSELAPKCDKLLILRVDRTLKAERLVKSSILFEGDIAFHNDTFLVIKDNGCQVQAIDMVGKARSIELEGMSFGCFVAVAVSPERDFVYIASVEHQDNCEEGYVLRKTQMGKELNCLQAVQNVVFSDLFKVGHAADQTGRVFILGDRTVHMMDEEGSEPRSLLTPDSGVYSPISLALDQDAKKLYIGMNDNNYLKVFKLG